MNSQISSDLARIDSDHITRFGVFFTKQLNVSLGYYYNSDGYNVELTAKSERCCCNTFPQYVTQWL